MSARRGRAREPVAVVENELTYEVDLASGQKTGFYCDQRENRLAVARYCRGRRVLDLFCFTGGFSLNALKHGQAMTTLGIDSSAAAIEAARRNAEVNGLEGATFEAGDVLKVLDRLKDRGDRFDVVVCDPPKYARHRATSRRRSGDTAGSTSPRSRSWSPTGSSPRAPARAWSTGGRSPR